MAETPPVGRRRNPFSAIDSLAVGAALKAAGSYDPDVLYAAKQRLLAPYRDLRRLAVLGILLGCALIFIVAMIVLGVLALVSSVLLWRFQARQVASIEAGYAQYLASAKS
ncbi:MAG TPA: hypothetical protein VGQ44_01300 [Gemmatimonadaceae bacterium]|nr:hypothetical protein [Gemmatimonadaceae bacterium]